MIQWHIEKRLGKQMLKWKIEKRLIKDLIPNKKNPRKLSSHDAKHLRLSLEKFGIIDKPCITLDGKIIGGHQRLALLKKMGLKEIEVYVPDRDLEDKEIDEISIRLNRALGEWDFDILANEWQTQDLIDWGFTPEELMIDADALDPTQEDGNGVLEPPKDPITKLGDAFELGEHRLVCGDSTDKGMVDLCLNGKVPILMVTDPPYGVEYDAAWRETSLQDGGKRAKGQVANDSQVDWSAAFNLFSGDVAYVWCASWFLPQVGNLLDELNYERIGEIIWVKQHFALSRGDYHWQHEPCWYAVKKGHPHNWQGSRKESTVWEIASLNAFGTNQEDERTAHSTQKPLECMAKPIRNNTAKGEGVYDPFLGSGTTLIAAEQLGRKCYAIELDPAYCDISIQRWIKERTKNGKDGSVIKNGSETMEYN